MKGFAFVVVAIFTLTLDSCREEYWFTYSVCNNGLYVESYTDARGIVYKYLTDSLDFNYFIGKNDGEHDQISVNCFRDSVEISKYGESNSTENVYIIVKRIYNIKDLKNHKITPKPFGLKLEIQ